MNNETYEETKIEDFAHCESCDKIINMNKDKWKVINDNTYCENCAIKESEA